jgi:nucleotide-binding universal stress UspA family protein
MKFGSEVVFLSVVEIKIPIFSGNEVPMNILDIQGEIEKEATLEYDKLLNSLIEKYKASGLILKKEIAKGLVDIEIEEFVKNNDIDLIVIGRRGFSPAKRFFVGSTTRKLVGSAPCSVMVVKE